jgi:hypothetical protein
MVGVVKQHGFMSKKVLKKLHIGDKEYVYTVKRGLYDNDNVKVLVYDTDTKQIIERIRFPEYHNITPSEVKEVLIARINGRA